jgi:class 3 adenylate cyclase/tetratricopeptide (TPR) repeat protein
MRCPQCGVENAPHVRFCEGCGACLRSVMPTASEGIAGRLQRLIPHEYAERLRSTRGQVGRERRLVTILFCDVQGSTAMAEGLDPEEVIEVMDGAFEFLIPPIYRHEGTLARLMGDAILAFFGAPLAHEDDPERAIRAGLEIIAGAQEYATKLEQEWGIRGFNVRVGIHTGQVVVGEVGSDLRAEYTAMGDAVNLAARMEQNAPTGGILITRATYRHVRGLFDVQAQPPLQVKGKAEPVQSYLVEGAKERAWRMGSRGVEGVETRMIGREVELLALQQAYREVVADRETQVVTALGEPGVGKSRLLDEFTEWVELERERVWYLRGRATVEGRAAAYSLWRDLFAYQFGLLETETAAEALARFRAGMAGLLEPDRADLVGHLVGFDFSASPHVATLLGSPSFGQVASAYLVQFLRALTEQAPVVMLLEDLHWADDSSLDLLALVVERLPDAPLLIVGAARPELWERRPNWGEGQEAYSRLELKPLSKRASRALVLEILQNVRDVPEAVQQLVVEGAEGNPFYAEELVKMLIEDGAIVPGEDEWRVEMERLAQVRVPSTLTAVLQARLDALPREEKEILQRASVVGREFWGSLVGELASNVVASEEVRGLLAALRRRELVYQRERSAFGGTEEYLFKHAVLRDVTYETVLLKLRRRYHAQVAAWLEGHAGERLVEYLSLIAGHYELAGEAREAIQYLLKAGTVASRQYANPEAIGHYHRALGLLDKVAEHEFDADTRREITAQLREGLGDVLARIGQHAEAQEAYQRALAQLRQGDNTWRARLYRKTADACEGLARYEAGLEACALAEAALGAEPDEPPAEWRREWIEIHFLRMMLYYWQARWQEMAGVAEEIGPVVARYGTAVQRATFHGHLARTNVRRERYVISDETLAHAQAARAASLESSDPVVIAANQFSLGFVHLWRGSLDSAEQELQASLLLTERTGDAWSRVLCLTYLTIAYRKRRQVEETRRYALRSLEAAATACMPAYVATARANLAWAAWREADLPGAWENGRAALETWQEGQLVYPFHWTALWPLIALAMAQDLVSDAVSYARELLDPTQLCLPDPLAEKLERAIGVWEAGDREAARASLEQAVVVARETGYL